RPAFSFLPIQNREWKRNPQTLPSLPGAATGKSADSGRGTAATYLPRGRLAFWSGHTQRRRRAYLSADFRSAGGFGVLRVLKPSKLASFLHFHFNCSQYVI